EHGRDLVKTIVTFPDDFQAKVHLGGRKELDGHGALSPRKSAIHSSTESVSARRTGSMSACSNLARIVSRSAGSAADNEFNTVFRFCANPAVTRRKNSGRSVTSIIGSG